MAQAINLQIAPSNVMPKIYASQFDIGREIKISLYDGASAYTPPVGTDIRFEGKKPDGNGFSYACTYSDNVVTVVTTDQMTVLAGEIPCELRMSLNGDDIGTLNIIFVIEKSPIDENVPISDTEIPAIIELARDEQYTAEAWAIGERDGVPVGPEDPAYHNNAKYWAEHAEYGALDDLTDVEITAPSDGQALIYDANTDEWVNGDVSTVENLSDLTDTDITTPSDGDFLQFNGANSEWVNTHDEVSAIENVYGSKNLCPYPYYDGTAKTDNGVTFVVDSDGNITANRATASSSTSTFILQNRNSSQFYLRAGTYKFTACPTGGSLSSYYAVIGRANNGAWELIGADTGDGVLFTVSNAQASMPMHVTVEIAGGYDAQNVVFEPMIKDSRIKDNTRVPYAKTNRELTEGLGNVKEIRAGRFSYTNGASIAGSVTLDKPFTKGTTTVVIITGESGNTQYITLFTVHGVSASGFSYIGKNVTGDTTSAERYAQYIAMRF